MKGKILLGVASIILMSSTMAGPGYVNRDCPLAGAKESMTLDWSSKKNYFYTLSYHLKRKTLGYEWEKHYNSPATLYGRPSSPPANRVLNTVKSYAGSILNRENLYYSGVYGIHYWFNMNARRWESRQKYERSCNLLTWGYNNW